MMTQTSTLRMTWLDRLRAEPTAAAALAIFVGSTATIVGAWYFEFVLKLPPCPLCLEQRLPYPAGVEGEWWAGPTECSGPITDLSAKGSILGQLDTIRVVRCDEAAWRVF